MDVHLFLLICTAFVVAVLSMAKVVRTAGTLAKLSERVIRLEGERDRLAASRTA